MLKTTHLSNRYLKGWTAAFVVSTLACLLLGLLSFSLSVHADSPSQASEQVTAHCLRKVPHQVRSSCPDIARRTRQAASHKCVSKDNNKDFRNCTARTAKGWITDADKKLDKKGALYKTEGEFRKALEEIFEKEGVDPNAPAPDPERDQDSETQALCDEGQCHDPAIGDAECRKGRCDIIGKWVSPTLNLLSLCFGVIAVISLIAGGITYMTSSGDSQKITAAKKRITNTILAVVAYMFLYAFLQFLIPGGTFRSIPDCPKDGSIKPPACKAEPVDCVTGKASGDEDCKPE